MAAEAGHEESGMTGRLQGKKGLIVGIANEYSIAWGCAKSFQAEGAELAITYLNDKALPHVQPLAEQVKAPVILPLDVQDEAQMQAVFDTIKKQWGQLDFLLHSVAFAPKDDLHGRITDCSREGFLMAMDISCYSFITMARLAEPLMKNGGCLITTSYYGSQQVIERYGVMGPVKAALEGAVKYMAHELGEKSIRVNALSPGPILTRAAGGIPGFEALIAEAKRKAPGRDIPTIESVGAMAAFLVSDDARHITGNISYVDCGYHIMG